MTMRRLVLAAIAGACCAFVAVTPGAASRQRPDVQTQDYRYNHGFDFAHYAVTTKALMPPFVFEPRPGDRWLHFSADDALGKGVVVHLYQRGDRGEPDLEDIFCADKLFRLASDEPVEIHVFTGLCPNHTVGFATTGTLTATFARRI